MDLVLRALPPARIKPRASLLAPSSQHPPRPCPALSPPRHPPLSRNPPRFRAQDPLISGRLLVLQWQVPLYIIHTGDRWFLPLETPSERIQSSRPHALYNSRMGPKTRKARAVCDDPAQHR
ncbi:hypothetical protein B0H17DRAFT_1175424 [Mycena rosella]|uniref:Uncharacterized protein n=1 Tax=Mycena rosella TaxID=1033263 RepID=A0AAD7GTH8_MYCRO|nr:hypothetical protein B0H17DRAFT_1175424 [Mycena rosella]